MHECETLLSIGCSALLNPQPRTRHRCHASSLSQAAGVASHGFWRNNCCHSIYTRHVKYRLRMPFIPHVPPLAIRRANRGRAVHNSTFCSSVREAGKPGAVDILVHWCHVGRQTQRWMPYRARPLQHRRQQQLALQGSMTMSVGPCCTSSVVVNFAHAL